MNTLKFTATACHPSKPTAFSRSCSVLKPAKMHHRLEQAWELKTAGKNIWEFDPAYRAVQQAGRSPKVTTKDEKSSAVSTPHRVSNVPQQTRLPGDEVLKRALEKEKEAIQMARNATRRFNEVCCVSNTRLSCMS